MTFFRRTKEDKDTFFHWLPRFFTNASSWYTNFVSTQLFYRVYESLFLSHQTYISDYQKPRPAAKSYNPQLHPKLTLPRATIISARSNPRTYTWNNESSAQRRRRQKKIPSSLNQLKTLAIIHPARAQRHSYASLHPRESSFPAEHNRRSDSCPPNTSQKDEEEKEKKNRANLAEQQRKVDFYLSNSLIYLVPWKMPH